MSPATSKQGLVYKTVGNLEICLDIHVPAGAKNVPILLWFHGGGLLQGHRSKVAPHMLNSVEAHQHALITADYRLAPQVGVQEIYQDVTDCISFIRDPKGLANQLHDPKSVNIARLAVSGSSAGGYLSLLAGLYVEPKPSVILPIYPITDPLGTFFTTSQPWPTEDHGKVILDKKVDEATIQTFLDRNAPPMANNDASSTRNTMYNYMLDRANLADLLHFNTKNDPQHNSENDKWRISRNIASNRLPPAYITHGTVDRDVGVEQADEVVGAMVGEGLDVVYLRLQGQDHMFDFAEVDDNGEKIKLDAMYEFMHKHV